VGLGIRVSDGEEEKETGKGGGGGADGEPEGRGRGGETATTRILEDWSISGPASPLRPYPHIVTQRRLYLLKRLYR
jgi:hypothetical protein